MTKFDDIHPDFQDLEHRFEKDIAPKLRAYEHRRIEAIQKLQKLRLILWPIAIIISGVLMHKISLPFGIIFLIVLCVLAERVVQWPAKKLSKTLQVEVMPILTSALGITMQHEGFEPPHFQTFRNNKLVPSSDRRTFEDLLRGTRHDLGFELYDAKLEKQSTDSKGNTTWTTVFRGMMVRLDYPRKFMGKTVVLRNKSILRGLRGPGKNYKHIDLASPKFEKIFDVWATDQTESHYLLDPLVLERFVELERLFHGKKLRAGFIEGAIYIAIETGDLLLFDKINKPLDDRLRIEGFLKEFAAIYNLIDVLVKRVDGKMGGAFSLEDVKSEKTTKKPR